MLMWHYLQHAFLKLPHRWLFCSSVPDEEETATAPSSLAPRPEFEGTPENPVTGNPLPKQSRIHCIIAACPYRSDTAKRASLAFVRCFRKPNPEDPADVKETYKKWIDAIALENPQKIGRRHMICQSHFHESDFARFGKQPALKKHAYPRLKLLGSDWPYVVIPEKPQKTAPPAAVPRRTLKKAIVTTAEAQPKTSAPRVEFFRVPRVQSSRRSLSDGSSKAIRLAQKPKKRKLRNFREEEDAESTESDGSEELSDERGWSRSGSSGCESSSQQEVFVRSASPGFSAKQTVKIVERTGVRRSARLSSVSTGKKFRGVSSDSEEETTEKSVGLHGQKKSDASLNRPKDRRKAEASKRKAEERRPGKRGGRMKKADHSSREGYSELGVYSKALEDDLLDTGLPEPEDPVPAPYSESPQNLSRDPQCAALPEIFGGRNSGQALSNLRCFVGAAQSIGLPQIEGTHGFSGAVWLDETMRNPETLKETSVYSPVAESAENADGGWDIPNASGILGSYSAVEVGVPYSCLPLERESEDPAHRSSVPFARSTGLPEFQVEGAGAETSRATWLEHAAEDSGLDLCDRKFSWSSKDPSPAERSRTDLWSTISCGNFVPPHRDQNGTKWSMKRDANVVSFSRIRERTCGCCDAATADHIVVKKDLSFFLWSGDPSSSPVHDLRRQSGTVLSMEQLTGCFQFDFVVFDHANFVKKTQTFKFRL